MRSPFFRIWSSLISFGFATLATALPLPGGELSLSHGGDPRVGTYTSSWKGFRTSSYWIEGPDGLILIDSQFLLSAGEEMVNWAEKMTGKKAKLAIILHPNPDKFNGTATFQKRGIKVVTSDQVLKHIPAVHKLRSGWFFERFQPDYPTEEPRPESFGNQTTELQAAGLTVKAHVLGEGCSDAHVVVQFEDNLFVGDLVTIGFHSWLELGHLAGWIERIKELEAMEPTYVRTGRGGSGDGDTLRRERAYLETALAVFRAEKPTPGKKLTPAMEQRILKALLSKYPSYDYPKFIENGIAASWAELTRPRR